MPTASESELGVIKIDNNSLIISEDGVLSINPEYLAAFIESGGTGGGSTGNPVPESGSISFGGSSTAQINYANHVVLDKRYTANGEISSISLTTGTFNISSFTSIYNHCVIGILEETEPGSDQYTQLGYSGDIKLVSNSLNTWYFSGITLKGDRAIKLYFTNTNQKSAYKQWNGSVTGTDWCDKNNNIMIIQTCPVSGDDTGSYTWGQKTYPINIWPVSVTAQTVNSYSRMTELPVGSITFKK